MFAFVFDYFWACLCYLSRRTVEIWLSKNSTAPGCVLSVTDESAKTVKLFPADPIESATGDLQEARLFVKSANFYFRVATRYDVGEWMMRV
jgi:hypothetical protein